MNKIILCIWKGLIKMNINRNEICKELIDYALDTGNVGLFNVLTSEHKYVYIERIIKRMETLPYNKIYRLKTYRNRVRLTVSQILEDEHGVYDWNIYDREARI